MSLEGLAVLQWRARGMTHPTPGAQDVLDAVERVLASADFDASPRSRDFLRFIVEETLADRQDGLTQSEIATRVFGRKADFDPTIDPIVRIQAGRLRRSLERYYLLSGTADPVRLELPRGAYVPVARWAGEPERGGTAGEPTARAGYADWPSITVGLRPESGPPDELASRFLDHLSVELGRYGDVQVLIRSEGDPTGRGRCYALSAHFFDEDGRRAVGVRLVDCRTSLQLWADEYRERPPELHDFHAETARIVAARVASEHGIIAQSLWKELPAEGARPTTYEALLRSYRFFFRRDPADFAPALVALREAVSVDPACALAWAQLSRLHAVNYVFEVAQADTSIEQALAFAQNAVRLDPSSERCHAAHAFALLAKGEIAAGLAATHAALAAHPRTFVYLETVGWLMALLGEWERGTALVREAITRNPHHLPLGYVALWADHLRRGEDEKAYQAALHFPDAGFFWRAVMRACSLGHLGRVEEAQREVAELLRVRPDFALRGRQLVAHLVKLPELQARVADGLAKAGLELH